VAAAKLSPLLAVSQSELLPLITKHKRPGGGDSRFEYLARGISVSQAELVEKLGLKGIGTDRDERRVIPNSDLAANLIGFTGNDLNGLNGLEGLEAKYDSVLRGRAGKLVFEQGNPDAGKGQFAKKEIPGGFRQETPAHPGSSLQLTIDSDLQHKVQTVLSEHMKRLNAGTGGAVVLDARSGEVLAQASYPPYDPTRPGDFKPADRDDAVSSFVVDPGSTHKALIFGAALEEGLVKPGDSIVVGPGLTRGGETFRDSHQHPKGTRVTLPGLLAYSSNVGTILLGDMLGPERIYDYQKRFGLGAPTGEGVAGEASGRLLAPSEWSGSASGSVPIGHSVDATLIQMAAAYATIANDGTYVQPHLIKATIAADGTRTPPAAPVTRRVLKPENAIALRQMLEAVVQVKGGTGNLAKLDDHRVAGKTGTGTRVINGRYSTNNTSSFIGMAPAEDPKYVVAVFGDVPQGTGGVVAGPAFKQMMEFTLAHYRVPPTGTKPPTFTIKP
jgi:cell division protein FtsI (penicillin-binding protein 3)